MDEVNARRSLAVPFAFLVPLAGLAHVLVPDDVRAGSCGRGRAAEVGWSDPWIC